MVTSMLLLLTLKTHTKQCILQTKWATKLCKNVVVVSKKIAEVYFKSLKLLFSMEHEHSLEKWLSLH